MCVYASQGAESEGRLVMWADTQTKGIHNDVHDDDDELDARTGYNHSRLIRKFLEAAEMWISVVCLLPVFCG